MPWRDGKAKPLVPHNSALRNLCYKPSEYRIHLKTRQHACQVFKWLSHVTWWTISMSDILDHKQAFAITVNITEDQHERTSVIICSPHISVYLLTEANSCWWKGILRARYRLIKSGHIRQAYKNSRNTYALLNSMIKQTPIDLQTWVETFRF